MTEIAPVEVTMHITAAPGDVFPYFTEPARYVQWMGTEAKLEPVPGGTYRVHMSDGFRAAGTFLQVDPPHRLAFTWGFADDDTWLDSFPVARTDYPLPFDMGLQAKPSYWGIVDETHLPGYGLSFAISSQTGNQNAQVWTVTATNGDVGPAYATQITAFQLSQIEGRPCNPVVTPATAYPIWLGDIPTSGTASAAFTINFGSCDRFARFLLTMPWNSSTYDTGTFVALPKSQRH